MKISRNSSIALLTIGLLIAAVHASGTTNLMGCIPEGEFDANVDYFPEKVTVEYAQYWNVDYENSYKVVTVYDTPPLDGGGLPPANQTSVYVFYQCGAPVPTLTDVQSDNVQYFSVPLQSVAITQTTEIPHFELLGLRVNVTAYAGDTQYVSSPCVNVLLDSGEIETFTNSTTFLAAYPDGVSLVSSWNSDKKDAGRVIINEGSEKGNLAIFEWHKLYGLLYNDEGNANALYDDVKSRYECVTSNAAQSAADGEVKPKLLWAYWSVWGEGWDVGECPNYYCEYAESCGAELMGSSEGSLESWGAVYMTDAEFEAHAKDADVWIYPSPGFNDILAQKSFLNTFASVQNQQVFDYQGSGEQAWFEQRLAEPDVVLQDFCSTVGVDVGARVGDAPHQRQWFRNIYTEGIGDAGVCEDVASTLETRADECSPIEDSPTGSPIEDNSAGASGTPVVVGLHLALTIGTSMLLMSSMIV